jgi:hypothetical protein
MLADLGAIPYFPPVLKVPTNGHSSAASEWYLDNNRGVQGNRNAVIYLLKQLLGRDPADAPAVGDHSGALRLRSAPDIATMQAITGAKHLDLCMVESTGLLSSIGLFMYVEGYSGITDSRAVTASGTPGGSWVAVGADDYRTLLQLTMGRTNEADVPTIDGVVRIRSFASTAALAAATGLINGDIALVRTDTSVDGLFVYAVLSGAVADGVTIVEPAGGSGRWLSMRATPKVAEGVIGEGFSSSSTDFDDVITITLSVVAGRPVLLSLMPSGVDAGHLGADTDEPTAGSASAWFQIIEGASNVLAWATVASGNESAGKWEIKVPPVMQAMWTPSSSGTKTFKFRMRAGDANSRAMAFYAKLVAYQL